MSQNPQDPELIARHMAKALDGIATIARIADVLVETNTRNTRELANLTALVGDVSETVDYLERIVVRDGDGSLVTKVSRLKDLIDDLKVHTEALKKAELDAMNVDRAGKWNMKSAGLAFLAAILAAIITAVLSYFLQK